MKDIGIKRRVFFAFFMGFAQATITMIVEILIILYLTSLKEHIEVIMKIVSLTVVVQLDTYYANSISGNPIKKANL